ncbi:MAG: YbaK/EbsC family protein [Acidobacteria bacterium]|nr:YbaK/EbsC family protein [Acidobacteriota bacterium]
MNHRLRQFLEKEKVHYLLEVHPTAYTAQEVAVEEQIPSRMMAKTIVLKAGDHFVLAVLPASLRMNLGKLKAALRAKDLRLASELEFTGLFPDCEIGAMPPFGNLYGVPVYADTSLAQDEEIVFNAGTHQDTIRMKYSDFARLAEPQVLNFALVPAA